MNASTTLTPDPLGQIRAEHVMISTDDYDGTLAWRRDVLGFVNCCSEGV